MYFRHGPFCKEAVWNEGQTVIIKPPHDYYFLFFFFAQQNEKNVNKWYQSEMEQRTRGLDA